jgi:hypothetical protein
MRTPYLSLSPAALLSAALVAAGAGPVCAESACKGLEQAVCTGNGNCTWVDGYTRKDGKQVSSHCKSIGKRADPAAAKGDKPAKPAKPQEQASKGTE